MQFGMDNDDMFENIQDPLQRLDEMEEGLLNHAQFIQNAMEQIKNQGEMILQLSQGLKEVALAMQMQEMNIDNLKIRMRVAEAKYEINK
jgi:hypothetical protein